MMLISFDQEFVAQQAQQKRVENVRNDITSEILRLISRGVSLSRRQQQRLADLCLMVEPYLRVGKLRLNIRYIFALLFVGSVVRAESGEGCNKKEYRLTTRGELLARCQIEG